MSQMSQKDLIDPMAQHIARSPFERQVEGGNPSGVLNQVFHSEGFPQRFIGKVWKLIDQKGYELYTTPYNIRFMIIPSEDLPPVDKGSLPVIYTQDQMLKVVRRDKPLLVVPGNIVVVWRSNQYADPYIYPRVLKE